MNFLYQKTFSARQDDSFKYPYRYFEEKKFQNFFLGWGVKKSKIFFQFYDVKSTEIFIFDIQIVAKCLVRGVLTNFIKKSPILGTLHTFKTFFIPTTEFVASRRFFWAPIWLFSEWWFFDQKSGKIGRNSKIFVKIVLITHFYLRVHILIFWFDE